MDWKEYARKANVSFAGILQRLTVLEEDNEKLRQRLAALEEDNRKLSHEFEVVASTKVNESEVRTMIQEIMAQLAPQTAARETEDEKRRKARAEIKSAILHAAGYFGGLSDEIKPNLHRRATRLAYDVLGEKITIEDAKDQFAKEVETELKKSAPTDLPVGGERVVEHLMNDTTLTHEEAVAKAQEAFKAIGANDVELAIEWLESQKEEEPSESSEGLSSDSPEEVAEMIATALGYKSFEKAKGKKAIKAVADEFASREASERTEDALAEVVQTAIETGQLRQKK